MSKDNPNFTIIAPGGCNSKCSFCTDPFEGQWNRDFMRNLQFDLATLKPDNFTQCSISGGEPTLSPIFQEILWCARLNFRKTVLTTNGARLMRYLQVVSETMTHVNVSRHAIGYDANVPIFQTGKIISDEELTQACEFLNSKGVDVNLNHVYVKGSTHTKQYVLDYVDYAKKLGANSVSFRYDQCENSLEETYLEALFKDYKIVNQGGCPVCRNHTVLIKGLPVVFKASFAEPSLTIKDVYELVFHIDGKLYTDWSKTEEFTAPRAVAYKQKLSTPEGIDPLWWHRKILEGAPERETYSRAEPTSDVIIPSKQRMHTIRKAAPQTASGGSREYDAGGGCGRNGGNNGVGGGCGSPTQRGGGCGGGSTSSGGGCGGSSTSSGGGCGSSRSSGGGCGG